MSVASVNNGSLQLSELVISNEKYSNATGYVASSSTFTSSTSGTSLSVSGDIVLPSGDIIVENGGLTVSGDITCTAITGTTSVSTPLLSLKGSAGPVGNLGVNSTGTTLFFNGGGGALTIGAITASGNISSTGDLTIADITASGNVSATGDLSGANVGVVNVTATGNITASGSVTGDVLTITGTSGNGNLGVSADGTALFFNGVQIYPAP
jgi:hypothetical protein